MILPIFYTRCQFWAKSRFRTFRKLRSKVYIWKLKNPCLYKMHSTLKFLYFHRNIVVKWRSWMTCFRSDERAACRLEDKLLKNKMRNYQVNRFCTVNIFNSLQIFFNHYINIQILHIYCFFILKGCSFLCYFLTILE